MSTPDQPVAARSVPPATIRTDEPRMLWKQVLSARRAVARQRHVLVNSSLAAARGELLSALEAYVESLELGGRPIPYALRDELRLQRLTCPADRYVRYEQLATRAAM
jgi:hypothetical protein